MFVWTTHLNNYSLNIRTAQHSDVEHNIIIVQGNVRSFNFRITPKISTIRKLDCTVLVFPYDLCPLVDIPVPIQPLTLRIYRVPIRPLPPRRYPRSHTTWWWLSWHVIPRLSYGGYRKSLRTWEHGPMSSHDYTPPHARRSLLSKSWARVYVHTVPINKKFPFRL